MSWPNLVFILIDDLGWCDLGCYGSSFYETPNLDRLAAEGGRFTHASAACPVCSPSRASLMTGKWPARLGMTQYIHDGPGSRGKLVDAPFVRELAHTEVSVATALREGGYATWHVGKWHLGKESFSPETHGFDVNIGGCYMGHPHHGYFSTYQIPTLTDCPEGEYLTDRLTDEAIALVERHVQSGSEKPFFLNFWHYAVHTPIQVPTVLKEKYIAKAVALGLDTNIGRLVARLPKNTIVIFTSDYETPLSSPDFYPTLLELAGLTPRPEQHVDGRSFVPLLGEFFEDASLELYNLHDYPSETTNLTMQHPERSEALLALLHNWQAEVEARFPIPNPTSGTQ